MGIIQGFVDEMETPVSMRSSREVLLRLEKLLPSAHEVLREASRERLRAAPAPLTALETKLVVAIKALRDAPHCEHFCTRLNDQEYTALETLFALAETAARKGGGV